MTLSIGIIIVLALGTATLRLGGMFAIAPLIERYPTVARVADLLPVAVVAAVIAQLTVGRGSDITVDARLFGLIVAGVLVWRRAPLIVIVLAAAAATAALRALV